MFRACAISWDGTAGSKPMECVKENFLVVVPKPLHLSGSECALGRLTYLLLLRPLHYPLIPITSLITLPLSKLHCLVFLSLSSNRRLSFPLSILIALLWTMSRFIMSPISLEGL